MEDSDIVRHYQHTPPSPYPHHPTTHITPLHPHPRPLCPGDLKEARIHTDLALEIDPDFCDVGYQVALLKVRETDRQTDRYIDR